MRLSPDTFRYLAWGSAVLAGMLLAVIDRRILRRRLLMWLLLASCAGGLMVMIVSPFRFGGTNYFMQGVIAAGGSALGLIGYAITVAIYVVIYRRSS